MCRRGTYASSCGQWAASDDAAPLVRRGYGGDLRNVLARLRKDGALTIRDVDDDVLVDKEHPWASRKPSKRALQLAFYRGEVTISERAGMLKTYELMDRHFGWEKRPSLRPSAQVPSTCSIARSAHRASSVSIPLPRRRAAKGLAARADRAPVRRGDLLPMAIEGAGKRALGAAGGARSLLPTEAAEPRSYPLAV